jgi:hypothetical protein
LMFSLRVGVEERIMLFKFGNAYGRQIDRFVQMQLNVAKG